MRASPVPTLGRSCLTLALPQWRFGHMLGVLGRPSMRDGYIMTTGLKILWRGACAAAAVIFLFGLASMAWSAIFSGRSATVDGFGDITFGMSADGLGRVPGMRCADMRSLWKGVQSQDGTVGESFFQGLFEAKQLGNSTVSCSGTIGIDGADATLNIFLSESGTLFHSQEVSAIEVKLSKYTSKGSDASQRQKEAVEGARTKIGLKYGPYTDSLSDDSFAFFLDHIDPGYRATRGGFMNGKIFCYANYQIVITETWAVGRDENVYSTAIVYRSPEYAAKFKERLGQIRALEAREKAGATRRDMSASW